MLNLNLNMNLNVNGWDVEREFGRNGKGMGKGNCEILGRTLLIGYVFLGVLAPWRENLSDNAYGNCIDNRRHRHDWHSINQVVAGERV